MEQIRIAVDKNQLAGNHALSNRKKHADICRNGAELVPIPIPFGDYFLITKRIQLVIDQKGINKVVKADLLPWIRKSIDTKKNLQELQQNVYQGHDRFVRELKKANGRMIVLVEESGMQSIEDVKRWENPRAKQESRASANQKLYNVLRTMMSEYDFDIQFCSREDSGKRIVEILTDDKRRD